ncbi:hypothetical protein BDY21DRAFT_281041 [Lineolata rhizophorae]|uniref:DUS-like FMN-binding domain-containing protein n=1 Tax=Lineolata rhizophorae TaxID=578093 RepID=A0A6A6P7G7_9PEZI|nr:hypothetical protein BDY21DRAFT_281041 [Lineolata rhizophorae]
MTGSPKRVPIPRNGVDYRGKVVLAPMVRSGELPMRLLALKYGADLVWGPETIDRAMIGTTTRVNPHTSTVEFQRLPSNGQKNPALNPEQKASVIYRLDPARERGRLVFQLGTASPGTAVEAAALVAPYVAGIDVNAGCPKPFSTAGGMGAALLRDPDRLCAILRALVRDVGARFALAVSVKIRLLETAERTERLVRALCATGIAGLSVHCRTTPMRPREPAIRDQLRIIAAVCREAGVACVMNGDVTGRDEAEKLVEEYGVDGAMIATAAEKNPSVFRAEKDGGQAHWKEVVREYMRFALEVDNRWANTKFSLGQLMPGKSDECKALPKCKGYTEIVEVLGLEEELGERAAEVDKRMGLGPGKGESRAQKRARAREWREEHGEQSLKKPKVPEPSKEASGISSEAIEHMPAAPPSASAVSV